MIRTGIPCLRQRVGGETSSAACLSQEALCSFSLIVGLASPAALGQSCSRKKTRFPSTGRAQPPPQPLCASKVDLHPRGPCLGTVGETESELSCPRQNRYKMFLWDPWWVPQYPMRMLRLGRHTRGSPHCAGWEVQSQRRGTNLQENGASLERFGTRQKHRGSMLSDGVLSFQRPFTNMKYSTENEGGGKRSPGILCREEALISWLGMLP